MLPLLKSLIRRNDVHHETVSSFGIRQQVVSVACAPIVLMSAALPRSTQQPSISCVPGMPRRSSGGPPYDRSTKPSCANV